MCLNHRTGMRLFQYFRNNEKLKKLFINEDLSLLHSAFKHQIELDRIRFDNDHHDSLLLETFSKKLLDNCKKIYSLSAVIAFAALIIAGPLTWTSSLIILFAISISITILWLKRNQTCQCDESIIKLAKQIDDERQLLTKLKELIEDNDFAVFNVITAISKLATSFRDIGIRCAKDFRQQTLALKELLPLKADIDDNLISSMPDDLYDSYNNCDVDNVRIIKSLRQLIRLQISEFFKRLLLIYVQNYYDVPSNFPEKLSNQIIIDTLNNILGKMLENSKCRQQELMTILSFYKSFYLSSSYDNDNQDKLKNENRMLWQNCRNVRKALYRSMAIIDDCETILDQSNTTAILDQKIKENLDCKFETMIETTTMANEMIQAIRRSLQHNHRKANITDKLELSTINDEMIGSNDNKPGTSGGLINECEPPKDEVFEAFIEDSRSRNTIWENDYDYDDDQTDVQMKDAENNMFFELRTALKDKHIEHRMREARAQGIELDREQIENEYRQSLMDNQTIPKQLMINDDNDHQMTTASAINSQFLEQHEQQSTTPLMGLNFQFDFNLAMRDSNQLKWRLNLNDGEETFGDSDHHNDHDDNDD
ncbi:hypothetical protein HUG17_2814 [Dermatophagoides farinae]|uniref:Vezatin n=1 Tax=Dermatophagoides farinae TaxID=6954 RepID=A0A9D4SEI9_DERFA|nr:uncharacterized protein LOC124490405 [Dermatophagoides farinae]KAH7638781.1 hypothetical protein HUG17_2814 [Dermatophagoides farinae]